MKAKPIITLLLFCMMAVGALAEEQSTLLVHLKDGNVVQLVIPVQKPEIQCYMDQSGQSIMIISYFLNDGQYPDEYLRLDRDQVDYLTFGETEVDAIEKVQEDKQQISFDLTRIGVVRVRGLKDSDRLQVNSLDGKSVNVPINRNGSEATVDLTQKPRGMYIVNVNQCFTFKLMKP